MIKDVILVMVGGFLGVVFMAFANEVGKYCEELNPFNNDCGNDFDEVD